MTPTVPARSPGSSSGPLMRCTRGQPASAARRSSARVLDELAEPMTTRASQRGAISMRADWRLVVAKHRSERPGTPQVGEPLPCGVEHVGPVAVAEGRLGQQGHGLLHRGQGGDLLDRLDPVDGLGGHGHGPDRLLMALVADVDDAVPLAGAHLDLVVHLGDQRAHGIDHVGAPPDGRRRRPRGPTRGPRA